MVGLCGVVSCNQVTSSKAFPVLDVLTAKYGPPSDTKRVGRGVGGSHVPHTHVTQTACPTGGSASVVMVWGPLDACGSV